MNNSSPAFAAWPAARRAGSVVIAHPAWESVRNAVLDRAAEGPVTVVLLGAPGTGKSWMLRELAGCLGDHGFSTTMLLQGDLPASLGDGAALLVDETLRMPEPLLDDLLMQSRGVVVLADVERFGDRVAQHPAKPVSLTLRLLTDAEVVAFAGEWLQQSGHPADILDPAAMARVVAHAGGVVRLVVQLLAAATALGRMSGQEVVSASGIDEAAAMRENGMSPPATEPAVPVPATEPMPPVPAVLADRARASRRVGRRALAATTAIAACVALAWAVGSSISGPPATPSTVTAVLPPLRPAETSTPLLADSAAPTLAHMARPSPGATGDESVAVAGALAPTPAVPSRVSVTDAPMMPSVAIAPPRLASIVPDATPPAPVRVGAIASNPIPDLGAPLPLSEAVVSRPAEILPSEPTQAAELPPMRHKRPAGGAGMVLLAQPGDTLESLYRDFYRNRAAPPYAEVVAINPRPVKPGGIVIFPEPSGGWSAQR